jgi:hypothetical protein
MADTGESEDDFFTKKQLDLMSMFETNLQKTLSAINNLKITGVEGDDSGGENSEGSPVEKVASPENDPRSADGYWKSYFRDDRTGNTLTADAKDAKDSKDSKDGKIDKFIDYTEKNATDSYDTDEKLSNKNLLKFSNNYLKGKDHQETDSENSKQPSHQNLEAQNSESSQSDENHDEGADYHQGQGLQRDYEIKRSMADFYKDIACDRSKYEDTLGSDGHRTLSQNRYKSFTHDESNDNIPGLAAVVVENGSEHTNTPNEEDSAKGQKNSPKPRYRINSLSGVNGNGGRGEVSPDDSDSADAQNDGRITGYSVSSRSAKNEAQDSSDNGDHVLGKGNFLAVKNKIFAQAGPIGQPSPQESDSDSDSVPGQQVNSGRGPIGETEHVDFRLSYGREDPDCESEILQPP